MAEPEQVSQFCLLLCLVFTTWEQVHSHSCSHSVPLPHEFVHGVHIEPAHRLKKRSISQRLRIHLQYDSSVSQLAAEKQKLVKNDLIPSAVAYWENTLQVRHTGGPIRLLRQCQTDRVRYQDGDPYPYCVDGCAQTTTCGNTVVPAAHLEACREARVGDTPKPVGYGGPGVQGHDFILYVSAHTTARCSVGTTVAYSAYCQLEGAMDRPVAGYVNLCPSDISTRAQDIHQMHSTIKHEILHALGFSSGLFAFFRDERGNPLTPRYKSTGKPKYNSQTGLYQWSEKVVKTLSRPEWEVRGGVVNKTIKMVVTPTVVREVRKHFNCSTLEGAELEDQGVRGTALTHWEKRTFENEMMTGTYTQNPLVSRVTLALMEDTGWYKANYAYAEPLQWGKNMGCDFVKKSCLEWMKMRKARGDHIHPFCDRPRKASMRTECTEQRDAVAVCNLVEYADPLEPKYQYFSQLKDVDSKKIGQYGGSVVLADYCPYIQEFHWRKGETVVRGSRCNLHQNNADPGINYSLERYGKTSKCFDHRNAWRIKHCRDVHTIQNWGSGCYQYSCSAKDGLSIHIHNETYRCYCSGQILRVQTLTKVWLHEGTVMCPSCTEICGPENVACPEEMAPPLESKVKVHPPCGAAVVNKLHMVNLVFTSILWLTFTICV